MKKITALLLVLALLSAFTACEKTVLPILGDDFKEENAILFPNDACKHAVVYQKMSDPSEQALYHITRCKFQNCDFVSQIEPHTLYMNSTSVFGTVKYKENGYLYHEYGEICHDCNERFTVAVLCRTQEPTCGSITREDGTKAGTVAHCMAGVDLKALFEDTPYTVVIE